ncbi:MAG: ABC transporter substrate-binding protein [Synechocystis sp.]
MQTSAVQKLGRSVACVISIFVLAGCSVTQLKPGSSGGRDRPLQIWWSEGYYPEETESIQNAIGEWEETSNQKAELTFYSEKDLEAEIENALQKGTPPDVIYGYNIDSVLLPRLAWNDQLADVSEILEPIKDRYIPQALESVLYVNQKQNSRTFYAVPISQSITHIHYWEDLLAKAGLNTQAIPQEWDRFWQLWQTAQTNLRQQGDKTIYGLGLPMSSAATDTNNVFAQFLEAYNVELIDPQGNLNLNSPNNRDGIIKALTNYTDFYQKGFVPAEAIAWNDPDNNVFFLSNLTVMTANATLSIPGSQRQDPINYYERMRTLPWPNKPDNTPMRSIMSVKQIAILKESAHLNDAKDLVTFLVQPENLTAFIEGSQGRFFPVLSELMDRPLWNDPQDPHLSNLKEQFQNSRPTYSVWNPAYSEVLAQNVWGEAIQDILINKKSPEKAADDAIKKIQTIFEQWQQ